MLEGASMLRYTYVYFVCLVLTHVTIYIPLVMHATCYIEENRKPEVLGASCLSATPY
jgi:hypothetical protein